MSALLSGQPMLGTQPLPALLAKSGNAGPAPSHGGRATPVAATAHSPSGNHATYAGAATPSSYTTDYGVGGASGPSPTAQASGGSTATYGNPTLTGGYAAQAPAAYGSSYGSAYGATGASPATSPSLETLAAGTSPASYGYGAASDAAQAGAGAAYGSPGYGAAYAPSGGAGPLPRNTQMYGQTLTNWSPSLPVSPWSTPAGPITAGGRLDGESVLRAELKTAKWGRFRARFYLLVVLGLVGTGAYYEFQERKELVDQRDEASRELTTLREVHEKTLTQLNAQPAAAAAKPSAAAAPAAAATSAGTAKLAEDLKRALVGAPFAIEARGDRVVVAIDTAALFAGKETEVGLGGYRTLYRFGKSLKLVKDRKVAITVPSVDVKRVKAWNLAAGRAVSLGGFFTTDLGFDAGRVSVSAPAPRTVRNATLKTSPGRIEFALDPV
jgi:hypothetical protein